jgi:hypothetical protein
MIFHLWQTEDMTRISLRKFHNTKENIIKILFRTTFLYFIGGCSYYFATEGLRIEIFLDQLEDAYPSTFHVYDF